ncbi:unnamed protein product [Phaeothamnion confervicola]
MAPLCQGHAVGIYAIDVHPDCSRFATGGNDFRIKIWSTAPIANAAVTEEGLLAVLTWHQQFVHCVRWSHDGSLLASTAAEGVIFVYALRPGPARAAPYGSGLRPNK